MTGGAKLTTPQKRVLECVDIVRISGRDWFSHDRPEHPETIGLRCAFDWLLANRFIEIASYRLTESGRSALARATEEKT